jgi:hypothetical protein
MALVDSVQRRFWIIHPKGAIVLKLRNANINKDGELR